MRTPNDLPDDLTTLPKTRVFARKTGSKYFFTGRACMHGHLAARRTSGGACIECQKQHAINYQARHLVTNEKGGLPDRRKAPWRLQQQPMTPVTIDIDERAVEIAAKNRYRETGLPTDEAWDTLPDYLKDHYRDRERRNLACLTGHGYRIIAPQEETQP
jgi:hypothetical protein